MAGGGDGYAMLVGLTRIIDKLGGQLMASQVMDYLKAKGSIAPEIEGRIPRALSRLGGLSRRRNACA